jgi:hypothetical protein
MAMGLQTTYSEVHFQDYFCSEKDASKHKVQHEQTLIITSLLEASSEAVP